MSERRKDLAELRLALEARGYEVMTLLHDRTGARSLEQWVKKGQPVWLEYATDPKGNVLDFVLFTRATESSQVEDQIAAIEGPLWSDPPRRGKDWDLFESNESLAVERVDDPDERDYPRFPSDDEAAAFVLTTAGWEDCPREDIRDECRGALAELVDAWEEEELPLVAMLEAVKPVLRRERGRWYAGTDDITDLVEAIEKRTGGGDGEAVEG